MNLLEICVIVLMKIYVCDLKAAFLKITENILFIAFEVMFLFVYGFSNSIEENSFLNLGFAMIVVAVLMVLFGVIRIIYNSYVKWKNFYYNAYG